MYSWNTERDFMCQCRGSITSNTQCLSWQRRSMRKREQIRHALAPLPVPGLASHPHEAGHEGSTWPDLPGHKMCFWEICWIFTLLQSWDRNRCTGSTLAPTACPGRRWHGVSFPVWSQSWSCWPSPRKAAWPWGSTFTVYLLLVTPGQLHTLFQWVTWGN